MHILITGGTGHLGREYAQNALANGHHVRIASRKTRPAGAPDGLDWATLDLGSGEGLDEALEGIDTVVHAASDPRRASRVDVEGTRRLAALSRVRGVRHLVYVSIVGIDRIPFHYYGRKLEAERAIAESGVPYSILRAAQFHYFIDVLLGAAARMPLVLPLPAGYHVQSIDTGDVAARMGEVLAAGPGGLLPDLAGPEPMTLHEAATIWKEVRGIRKPIVSLPIPGKTSRAFRAGYNTAPHSRSGVVTWRRWLERKAEVESAGRLGLGAEQYSEGLSSQ